MTFDSKNNRNNRNTAKIVKKSQSEIIEPFFQKSQDFIISPLLISTNAPKGALKVTFVRMTSLPPHFISSFPPVVNDKLALVITPPSIINSPPLSIEIVVFPKSLSTFFTVNFAFDGI